MRDLKKLMREGKDLPGRKCFPLIVKMFEFPGECVSELLDLEKSLEGQNDLYQDYYGLSKTITIAQQVAYSTPGYVQHLLQLPNDDGFQTEKNYVVWNDLAPKTKRFMRDNWPVCFRARLAILQPNTTIPWHIDDDTRISFRFHVNLNRGQTKFWFKVRNEETFFELEPYQAYFLNVGYPHKVENTLNFKRINFLWGSDWSSAETYLKPYLIDPSKETQ
jgi:hypothetical protein